MDEKETQDPEEKQEPTVNKHKFDRMQERAEQAEAKLAELQKQVEELTAKQGDSETTYEATLKALREEADKAATEAAARVEQYEAQIARDAQEKELLKAGCIDAELGVKALAEGQTVEQLKEAKPYLFKADTKPSGGEPKGAAVNPDDELTAKMKAALGIK